MVMAVYAPDLKKSLELCEECISSVEFEKVVRVVPGTSISQVISM